jgi:hypothetical protein
MGLHQRDAGVHQRVRVVWAEVDSGAMAVGYEADVERVSIAQDERERKVSDDDEAKGGGELVAQADGDGVGGVSDGSDMGAGHANGTGGGGDRDLW